MRYMCLHLLYKDGRREHIDYVLRFSNLSTKNERPLIYYETLYNEFGRGTVLYLDELLCYELNFETV